MRGMLLFVLLVAVCAAQTLQPEATCHDLRTITPSRLPDGPLAIGYANWGQCDEAIHRAVRGGLNVVIWFAINLETSAESGKPVITSGPDFACVARMVTALRAEGLNATHLISIGGWNAPHPSTDFTGQEWFEAWQRWNCEVVSRPDLGFHGFDGFDWDIEGNDTPSSQWNHFTMTTLNVMGDMSAHAKAAGYVVTMAPAESYVDPTTSAFDLDLTHAYPEWHPEFLYHGHNTYAYLLAKYPGTFDLVSVQVYESWSHAAHCVSSGVPPAKCLTDLATSLYSGWEVSFDSVPETGLPSTNVSVLPSQLIIGLANGWVDDAEGRAVMFWPEDISQAYHSLKDSGVAPRGFMFWNIADEGRSLHNRTLFMAEELNKILHVR